MSDCSFPAFPMCSANGWIACFTCIGNLNLYFFCPELYRQPGEVSIVFLVDENPNVASAGLGGVVVGGARFARVPWRWAAGT
jgi:hypothetical protein